MLFFIAFHARRLRNLPSRVIIIPDNDADGERYAQDVVRSLMGIAAAVKIVRLPGLQEHGDVSDWLDAGHPTEELLGLVKVAPCLQGDGFSQDRSSLTNTHGGMLFARLGDMMAEQEEGKPYLVTGLLPSAGISLLAGKPKAGKSTLARCLNQTI